MYHLGEALFRFTQNRSLKIPDSSSESTICHTDFCWTWFPDTCLVPCKGKDKVWFSLTSGTVVNLKMMETGRSHQLFLQNIMRPWPHLDAKSVQALCIMPSSAFVKPKLKQASLLSLHRMHFSANQPYEFSAVKKPLVHYETWLYFF